MCIATTSKLIYHYSILSLFTSFLSSSRWLVFSDYLLSILLSRLCKKKVQNVQIKDKSLWKLIIQERRCKLKDETTPWWKNADPLVWRPNMLPSGFLVHWANFSTFMELISRIIVTPSMYKYPKMTTSEISTVVHTKHTWPFSSWIHQIFISFRASWCREYNFKTI